MALEWRIYYGNGSTYSNEDGPLEEAPGPGVQVIVASDETVGRYLLHRQDNYWWTGQEWLGGDRFGLWDYLQRSGWKKVLFGRMITDSQFREIFDTALNDPDFPRKSAWHRHEHRPAWLQEK
jgi:hypothetical protein